MDGTKKVSFKDGVFNIFATDLLKIDFELPAMTD